MGLLPAAVLAKAKASAMIAASLAAGGIGGAVALSHVAPTTQHVVDTAASETPAATDPVDGGDTLDAGTVADEDATTVDASPSPAATFSPPPCPDDAKNHGRYVGSVARTAPHGKGTHHGEWVSEAAKGDCGKPAPDAGDDADANETDGDEAAVDRSTRQNPDTPVHTRDRPSADGSTPATDHGHADEHRHG